mgnify:CR=1 FL=1
MRCFWLWRRARADAIRSSVVLCLGTSHISPGQMLFAGSRGASRKGGFVWGVEVTPRRATAFCCCHLWYSQRSAEQASRTRSAVVQLAARLTSSIIATTIIMLRSASTRCAQAAAAVVGWKAKCRHTLSRQFFALVAVSGSCPPAGMVVVGQATVVSRWAGTTNGQACRRPGQTRHETAVVPRRSRQYTRGASQVGAAEGRTGMSESCCVRD